MRRSHPGWLRRIKSRDLAGLAPMIKAVAGLLLGSGGGWAPTGLQATSLQPCGSIRIANTTFCFLDANGDGRYQEAEEEFARQMLTRGGLRCRGQGVIAKPVAESGVLKIRVLTSWDEACPGSKSVDSIIDTCVMAIASLRPRLIRRCKPKPMVPLHALTQRIHQATLSP